VPCAKCLIGSCLRSSPVNTRVYTPTPMARSMGPGCRKSGSANGSQSEILRSLSIGNDGWIVMTVGIINNSTSVSKPDVPDESLGIDLIAFSQKKTDRHKHLIPY